MIKYDNQYHTPKKPPPPQSQIDLSPLADHSVAEVFWFLREKAGAGEDFN